MLALALRESRSDDLISLFLTMSRINLARILPPAAIIIAGLVSVFYISAFIETHRPALAEGYADTDLNVRGSALKGFAMGMEGLIADWYYMRSLQYIGDKILNSKDEVIDIENLSSLNPRLLYPLLDTATDLDPHFIAAYNYGAILLPAIDPEKAILIAQKGIRENPNSWRLYQYLGYIFWKLGKYPEAADTFEKGSQIAGAAPFMTLMAASMQTEGGSRETARAVYRQMLTDSDDPMVKLTAERRLAGLDSMDERDAIDRALAESRDKTGRCPTSFSEIIPALMTVQLPQGNEFNVDRASRLVDPTGAPYVLDQINCRSMLDTGRTQLPLK